MSRITITGTELGYNVSYEESTKKNVEMHIAFRINGEKRSENFNINVTSKEARDSQSFSAKVEYLKNEGGEEEKINKEFNTIDDCATLVYLMEDSITDMEINVEELSEEVKNLVKEER